MEQRRVTHYAGKISYPVIFFAWNIVKNFLASDIIKYLKYVYFEFDKVYCLEFDTTGVNIERVHLFADFEPKYSPSK